MKQLLSRHQAALAAALLAVPAFVQCEQVVGAECATDYQRCGEVCCAPSQVCESGQCRPAAAGTGGIGGFGGAGGFAGEGQAGADTAGAAGAAMGGTAGVAGSVAMGGMGGFAGGGAMGGFAGGGAMGGFAGGGAMGGMGGGQAGGCPLGTTDCFGTCVDVDSNALHCGMCGNECSAAEICSGGTCTSACEGPRIQCGDICVDPTSNDLHCNGCNNACEVGSYCVRSACKAGRPGHIILIGHDYMETDSLGQDIVGNAVFTTINEPVNVLSYEEDAAAQSITKADAAIESVAVTLTRTWTKQPVTAPMVTQRLIGSDVFLIYSQHDSTDSELQELGRTWETALDTFLARDGVVIVLDGGGSHDGSWQILDAANLLDIDGRSVVPAGTDLEVADPTDTTMRGIEVVYEASNNASSFVLGDNDLSDFVAARVAAGAKAPVVLHKGVK